MTGCSSHPHGTYRNCDACHEARKQHAAANASRGNWVTPGSAA